VEADVVDVPWGVVEDHHADAGLLIEADEGVIATRAAVVPHEIPPAAQAQINLIFRSGYFPHAVWIPNAKGIISNNKTTIPRFFLLIAEPPHKLV
jgi:hypothetical protein